MKRMSEIRGQISIRSIAREIFGKGWVYVAPVAVPFTFGLLGLYFSIEGGKGLILAGFFALLAVPILHYRRLCEGVLLGYKASTSSLLAGQIIYPLSLVAICLVVAGVGAEPDDEIIWWAYFFGLAVSLLAALVICYRVASKVVGESGDKEFKIFDSGRSLLGSSIPLGLVSMGFILSQNLDALLVGLIKGAEEVAVVRVAAKLAEAVAIIRVVAIIHYKPRIASAFYRGDKDKLYGLVYSLRDISLLASLPVFVLLLLFSSDLLGYFDSSMAGSGRVLVVYSIGILFTIIVGPTNTVLTMVGGAKYSFRALVAALVVNLVLDLLLIPSYGALGCAFANALSLVIYSIITGCYCSSKYGIETWAIGFNVRRVVNYV